MDGVRPLEVCRDQMRSNQHKEQAMIKSKADTRMWGWLDMEGGSPERCWYFRYCSRWEFYWHLILWAEGLKLAALLRPLQPVCYPLLLPGISLQLLWKCSLRYLPLCTKRNGSGVSSVLFWEEISALLSFWAATVNYLSTQFLHHHLICSLQSKLCLVYCWGGRLLSTMRANRVSLLTSMYFVELCLHRVELDFSVLCFFFFLKIFYFFPLSNLFSITS